MSEKKTGWNSENKNKQNLTTTPDGWNSENKNKQNLTTTPDGWNSETEHPTQTEPHRSVEQEEFKIVSTPSPYHNQKTGGRKRCSKKKIRKCKRTTKRKKRSK